MAQRWPTRGHGWAAGGLIPIDEGSWMMHCHILEHAEAGIGMMTLIDVIAPRS